MNSSPAAKTRLVFAYGSNMLTRRLRQRCPSATAISPATLEGYALRWHKRSTDGSGKCDVVRVARAGERVQGVLYEISASDKPALDRAEGLGHGYEQVTATVTCNGQRSDAAMYCATDVDGSLKPYTWYKALVVAGASEHGLPDMYIESLRSVTAIDDPDKARHALNMKIVDGSNGGGK